MYSSIGQSGAIKVSMIFAFLTDSYVKQTISLLAQFASLTNIMYSKQLQLLLPYSTRSCCPLSGKFDMSAYPGGGGESYMKQTEILVLHLGV